MVPPFLYPKPGTCGNVPKVPKLAGCEKVSIIAVPDRPPRPMRGGNVDSSVPLMSLLLLIRNVKRNAETGGIT